MVIGIDGLDSELLSKYIGVLPNFKKLMDRSYNLKSTSIFPPDSVPAWISIYTGLNPARHGVLNFINPKNKEDHVLLTTIGNQRFQGKTFWDYASKCGKKVCLILPYAVYPAYAVDGVMVCRTMETVQADFPLSTFPESVSLKHRRISSKINLQGGFPSARGLSRFIDSCQERTTAEANLGISFLKEKDWDLFFIYFSALDAIQHVFRSYCDEEHPDFVQGNPYQEVIKSFYVLFDKVLGQFAELAGTEVVTMVISDHGHSIRPTKLLNINEILRRNGFLKPKNAVRQKTTSSRNSLLKGAVSILVNRVGINNTTLKFLHRFPIWKKIFASASFIDWDGTLAYVSDLSAVKSYSYGGVIVDKKNSEEYGYDHAREDLIRLFSKIPDPLTGKPIVKWICKREDLYLGKFINKYPDLLLELKNGYGLGWEINVPQVTSNPTKSIQPGSHDMNSPVLLISEISSKDVAKKKVSLMDIAPTILDILGIENVKSFDFEGEPVLCTRLCSEEE